jgi:hypothetical protein
MSAMLLRLDTLLTQMIRAREIKICAIEEPFQSFGAKNAKTQLMLWNLCGTAQAVCAREGVDYLIVQPARWRTVFLPHANCKGDEWKRAAERRCQDLGWPATDHNAAEACGIWAWLKSGNESGWQAKVLGAEKMALPKATQKFFEKRARLG